MPACGHDNNATGLSLVAAYYGGNGGTERDDGISVSGGGGGQVKRTTIARARERAGERGSERDNGHSHSGWLEAAHGPNDRGSGRHLISWGVYFGCWAHLSGNMILVSVKFDHFR